MSQDETELPEAEALSTDSDASGGAAAEADHSREDDAAAFLSDLAQALHTAAGLERARIAENIERRRQAHIDTIRSREVAEADKMRELAKQDTQGIDSWADDEVKRIQQERGRRTAALKDDLKTSLDQHRSLIAREIERVEGTIAAYRADVDRFFSTLDAETDPVAIAQQASRRPAFPALDESEDAVTSSAGSVATETPAAEEDTSGEVSESGEIEATTDVTADAPMVGVMDSEAVGAQAEMPAEIQPEVVSASGPEEGERSDEPDQPVEAMPAMSVTARESSALLRRVPTNRPMGSWLRRNSNEDRSDPER